MVHANRGRRRRRIGGWFRNNRGMLVYIMFWVTIIVVCVAV
jgi:hypothetical protein